MSSCSDDRLTYRKLGSLAESRRKKKMGERSLITLFQGREVLPCVSLYMLELHCYKHTHVRKECSLLLSFGPGISCCNRKVIKETTRRFLNLFVFHSKNYYLMCDLCLSGFSRNFCFFLHLWLDCSLLFYRQGMNEIPPLSVYPIFIFN